MTKKIDNAKRGFLKWMCRLTGGYIFLSFSPSPLKRVNMTLLSEAHGQTACKTDTCTTRDACEGDSVGHTCSVKDVCDADESGDCTNDTCTSDRSLTCNTDSCTSDSSGACVRDTCLSDSSGGCKNDTCRSDSSGSCVTDQCLSDSSGACTGDSCDSDSAISCESDTCISDSSGACGVDHCNQDASGACTVRDICIIDNVDLCRSDSSPDCATFDTCALDLVTGMRSGRQTLAAKGLNRALKWLYNLGSIILFVITASFANAQDAVIAIDATNAIFLPSPTYITGTAVSVSSPVGPFLRDCDGDGILEADTNGDGQCAEDPKVMDHRGIGTRELPPGTPFNGSFEFTCFYIPDDVAIIATGPLTIAASREVAIFGAMRLTGGAHISTPVDIYAFTSAWLSDTGNITLTTALSGLTYTTQLGFADGENVPRIQYISTCDVTGTAVRAIIPPEVAQGSIVTIKGSNLGTVKGKVALGTVKAKVKTWTPESITAEFKKVPLPGTYPSVVTPKKATPITTVAAYQVKAPAVLSVIPDGGWPGDMITLQGKFFGKKKGKLTLGDTKCKVVSWTMDARTGASEAKFAAPTKLDPGYYTLTLTNKVGSSPIDFELYEPLE
jgi:hypothetical protein